MSGFFDRQGRPIELEKWMVLIEDEDYVKVAHSTVGPIGVVSTVWLGIDHNYGGEGPPIIFETMVFPQHPAMLDLQWRYSTEEQARHGHFRARAYLTVYLGHDLPAERKDGKR